ncbi:MAG: hypothetical protein ACFBSG_14775 [Leptolyngbyaceae cyanobacterium]
MEILFAIAILVASLWWLNRKRSKRRRYPVAASRSRSGVAVPEGLMRRLDRLTKDRRVSQRLIERVELNHPGRSKRWCVEKAIYDLQRDRRS